MSEDPVATRDVDEEFEFISAAELAQIDKIAGQYDPQAAVLRIGGSRSVAAVVASTYLRLLEDPLIGPILKLWVKTHNLSVVMRHQVYMLTTALGGGDQYDLARLGVHKELGITHTIYWRTCLYMITVLHEVLMAARFDVVAAMDIEVDVHAGLEKLEPLIVADPTSERQVTEDHG